MQIKISHQVFCDCVQGKKTLITLSGLSQLGTLQILIGRLYYKLGWRSLIKVDICNTRRL